MNQLELAFTEFGFSEKHVITISTLFKLKQYKRGDYFLQDGKLGEYIGFVNSGMFQFYVDTDSAEITTYIAFRNDFILSIQCYFAGKPSKENIKALVDSEVCVIRKVDFKHLIETIGGFKEFYIKVLENLLTCLDESRFDYITLKPEERYLKLLTEEPELLQQVPLKYLSALIGVTPRHLSRIRKGIQKE